MATQRKGVLAKSPEWWVHLRNYNKKLFWNREKQASQKDIREQCDE